MDNILVVETKLYNLSTRGIACNILNNDTNYKSKCQYNIPDMIERDESIEHINLIFRMPLFPFLSIRSMRTIIN